jgi:hypothetical protein
MTKIFKIDAFYNISVYILNFVRLELSPLETFEAIG